MISGLFSGLLRVIGFIILRIVYGKEKYKRMSERSGLAMFLSVIFAFWLLCLIFLIAGVAANDFWIVLLLVLAFPLTILMWAIIARKNKTKPVKQREEPKKVIPSEIIDDHNYTQKNTPTLPKKPFVCGKCGRAGDYAGNCPDCGSTIKKYIYDTQ